MPFLLAWGWISRVGSRLVPCVHRPPERGFAADAGRGLFIHSTGCDGKSSALVPFLAPTEGIGTAVFSDGGRSLDLIRLQIIEGCLLQEFSMSTSTTVLPPPDVSPDVRTFAEEQGVATYLPAVLAMTRRIFPAAPMHVFLEDDPEIENDWHIILEVQVPRDATPEFFVETDDQWCHEIFQHCPARYVCIFRLGVTPSA
jgi:hypothetical protein